MAEEYSRSDFLRALMTQKNSLAQQDNVLVNPSVAQAAALDNSFQGVQAEPEPESNDRNWWQRTIDTLTEIGSNVTEGVVGFFDSIGDALIYGAGAIGSAFGASTDWAKEAIAYDWNGYAVDAMQRVGSAPFFDVLSGDIFTNDYWTTNGRDRLAKQHEGSWVNEASDTFKDYYQSIEQGIGNVLPNIVLGVLTGGSASALSAAGQMAVGTAVAATQGFGSGVSEALQDGATYGQAGAYGALSGAIEAGTEAASAGIGKLTGAGSHVMGRKLGEKITKLTVKEVVHSMAEEGAEEFVSEWLSPLAKSVYKGDEALKAYQIGSKEWRDQWHNSIVAFAGGAAGGALGSVISTNVQQKMIGDTEAYNITVDISNELTELDEARLNDNKAKIDELQNKLGEDVKTLQSRLDTLEKENPEAYKRFLKALADPNLAKSEAFKLMKPEEQLKVARDSINARFTADSVQHVTDMMNDLYSKSGIDVRINWSDDADLNNRWLSVKTKEDIVQLNDKEGGIKGFFDPSTGQVYLSRNYEDEFGSLIRHEAFSHGVLDANEQIFDRLYEFLDKNDNKNFHKNDEDLDAEYKGESEKVLKSERMAWYLENHLSANDLVKLMEANRIERLNLAALLRKIKSKLAMSKTTIDSKIMKEIDKAIKSLQTKVESSETGLVNRQQTQIAYRKVDIKNEREYNSKEVIDRYNENTSVEDRNNKWKEWSKVYNNSSLGREKRLGRLLERISTGEETIFDNEDNYKEYLRFLLDKDVIKEAFLVNGKAALREEFYTPEMVVLAKECEDLGYAIRFVHDQNETKKDYAGLYFTDLELVFYNLETNTTRRPVVPVSNHERLHFIQYEHPEYFREHFAKPVARYLFGDIYDELGYEKFINDYLFAKKSIVFEELVEDYGGRQIYLEKTKDLSRNDIMNEIVRLSDIYDVEANHLEQLTTFELKQRYANLGMLNEVFSDIYGQIPDTLYILARRTYDVGVLTNITESFIKGLPTKNGNKILFSKDPTTGTYEAGSNKMTLKVNKVASGYDIVIPNDKGGAETIHKTTAKEVDAYMKEINAVKKTYEKSEKPKGFTEVKGEKVETKEKIYSTAKADAMLAQADAMYKETSYKKGDTVYYKNNGEVFEAKINSKKTGEVAKTKANKEYKVKEWSLRIKSENGDVEEKTFKSHKELKEYLQKFPIRSNDRAALDQKVKVEEAEKVTQEVFDAANPNKATAEERMEQLVREAVEEQKAETTAVKRTEDIKNYAKANYDKFVTLKSANDIKNVLTSVVQLNGDNSQIRIKTDVGQNLFEDYNKFRGKKLTAKLEETLREWVQSKVTYIDANEMETTIAQILKVDGYDEDQMNKFITGLAEDVQSVLEEKSDQSKLGKLQDLMLSRLGLLQERIKYYRNYGISIVKTSNLINKIKEKVSGTNITNLKAQYGLNSLQFDFIKQTFSGGITVSKSYKGFSPNSVTKVVDKLGWYSEENLRNVFPWYEYRPEIAQFIKDIKADYVDLGEGQRGLRGQVSLENTVKFNEIVKEIYQMSKSIESQAAIANLKANRKAFNEWEIVKKGFAVNDKNFAANVIAKIFRETSSPASTFASRFGSNSQIYKTLYTDIVESNSAHLTQMCEFKNQYLEIAAKYDPFKIGKVESFREYQKVQDKVAKYLGKEISMTFVHTNENGGDPTNARMPLGVYLDIYMHAQTVQGYNTLKNGGYNYTDRRGHTYNLHHMSAENITEVEGIVREWGLIDFANEISEKLYNGELRQYKVKADRNNFGIENVQGDTIYYPNNKDVDKVQGIDKDAFNNHMTDPAQWNNNKINKHDTWYAIKGMDFETRFDNYVHSLTVYGEMYQACKNFDTLRAKMLKFGKADNYIRGFEELINYYADQIAGRPVNKSGVGSGKLYSNIVSATLGGNISVVMKQTASLPTIMNEVRLSSFLKGLSGITNIVKYGDIKSQVAEVSGLLALRWGKGEVIKAATLADTVNKFAKVFGIGMEFVDSAVILTVGYRSAQYEAQALYGYEVGTKENTDAAVKILERIVAKTQSNSINLEMSMARSGAAGVIPKVLSIFSSDLQNKISYINQLFSEKYFAQRRNEGAKKYLGELQQTASELQSKVDELQAQLEEADEETQSKIEKDLIKASAELEDIKQDIDNTNESIKLNDEIIDDKLRTAKQAKLLVSLAFSAAMIVGIEQLVKRLLGKKGWDEKEKPEDLIKAFLLESTIFNLPYVSQIYNAIDYDNDIGAFDLTLLNDAVDLINAFRKDIENGQSGQKWLMPLFKVLGDLTGIPVSNLYNLTIGGVKMFDFETGTKWDAFVRGYSTTYVTGAYKAAVEAGGDKTAKKYLSLSMSMYRSGKASDEVINELHTLYTSGYDVLPKNYMTTYTDENGAKVALTQEQVKTFKETYQLANTAVESMMKVTDYRNATPEIKSKLIKSLFDAYYDVAKARVTKSVNGLSKVEKLIYYSSNKFNVTKYLPVLNAIKSIQATASKTKKDLTVTYINRLSGFSRQEKLLLMYLNGYTVKDASLKQLKSYLTSRGIVKAGINEMFGN